MKSLDLRPLLRDMFAAAVAAAQPALCVPPHLPATPNGRLVVIGAGKASAAMARAVEDHWQGPLPGLVVTRYGCAVPYKHIEIVEAAHPVPDAAGEVAARRLLAFTRGPHGGRPGALPDLGRRLVAAAVGAPRLDAWRQAVFEPKHSS